jgi:hypothetical protein
VITFDALEPGAPPEALERALMMALGLFPVSRLFGPSVPADGDPGLAE